MSIERAERLGAAMLLFGLVREPATAALEANADLALLAAGEWEAWREADDEDVRLAHACLSTEFELRERQWRTLEFLLYVLTAPEVALPQPTSAQPVTAAGPPSGGSEPEPMILLPRAHIVAVAELALGWHTSGP